MSSWRGPQLTLIFAYQEKIYIISGYQNKNAWIYEIMKIIKTDILPKINMG